MSPELQKPAKKLPPGYIEFPDSGVAYKVYKKKKTWGEAKKYCAGEGANLAVIDSFQKVEYVMDLRGPDQIDVHVGIHRFFDDSEWVEIRTGLPPTSIPWRRDPYLEDKSRKCSVIDEAGNGLSASHCTGLYYFVCEIPVKSKG